MAVKIALTTNIKTSIRGTMLTQVFLIVDIDATHLTGDLGGWVESIDNLKNPTTGDLEGVILDDAQIEGNARIYGEGMMKDTALAYDNAQVYDNAVVGANSILHNNTIIRGNAVINSRVVLVGNSIMEGTVSMQHKLNGRDIFLDADPLSIAGSVHYVMYFGGMLYFGCLGYSLEHWQLFIDDIGAYHNYTAPQVIEYKGYLTQMQNL